MTGKKVAIIGGDLRQKYMAGLFISQRVEIVTYGLKYNLNKNDIEYVKIANNLKEAVRESDIVLAPIPLTKDGNRIYALSPKDDLRMDLLIDSLHKGQTLYAGCITKETLKTCKDKGVKAIDFMEIEEVVIFNSIATAEGAICEAILEYPSNIHKSKCIILGFGRCAKTLADKLKGMSAKVTICVRSGKARAEAEAYGYHTCTFGGLKDVLSSYNLIFNTVPHIILGEVELQTVKDDAVIIDVASSPGGLDYESAKRLGKKAKLCLGLPGKYAPKASAEELIKWMKLTMEYN